MRIIEDESRLTIPCAYSKPEDSFAIIDLLDNTLKKTKGIGLAANQIGILKRVCIVRVPTKENYILGYNFVNPEVIEKEEPVIFNEGCLSYPGKSVITLRFNRIKVTDSLEPKGRILIGLAAICAQHEINHTEGITMYDHELSKLKSDSSCPCGSKQLYVKCCKEKAKNFKF